MNYVVILLLFWNFLMFYGDSSLAITHNFRRNSHCHFVVFVICYFRNFEITK